MHLFRDFLSILEAVAEMGLNIFMVGGDVPKVSIVLVVAMFFLLLMYQMYQLYQLCQLLQVWGRGRPHGN